MDLRGKKLGLLLSGRPEGASFLHGIRLAEAALQEGVDVFLYCIHDAVAGVADVRLQSLRSRGLKLYACAYGAQKRNIAIDDKAVFAGLGVASDIMAATDRFLSFN
jgi:hypothetical protein